MKLPNIFKLFSAKKRRDIEYFPPYWLSGVEILENRDNWRYLRIKLPLGFFTRNMGGSMFGGSQAALADPIPAIACAHLFPEYSVWTRDLYLDFQQPSTTDLELRFRFDPEQEAAIREELLAKERSTPHFELGFYDTKGQLCTVVRNTVAIRPRGYRRTASAYHKA